MIYPPLSNEQLAIGWRVLGCGDTIEDAKSNVAHSGDFMVSLWANRQREALAGFCRLIEKATP